MKRPLSGAAQPYDFRISADNTLKFWDDDVSNIDPDKEQSIESAFDIIMKCIVSVFDDDGVYTAKNEGPKQMKEFIESLNTQQFQNISAFFENMPALKSVISFKCSNCSAENETELRGLQSFFT